MALYSPVIRPAVRPSVVCQSTPISHDAISLYLVEEFQWNLLQIFIMWEGIAEKVCEVKGQTSRLWPDELTYNGESTHFDGAASWLTSFIIHWTLAALKDWSYYKHLLNINLVHGTEANFYWVTVVTVISWDKQILFNLLLQILQQVL